MAKTKTQSQSFAGIPRVVMEHDDYKGLSGNGVKLLMALAYQYRGSNNGNLTAAWSVMQKKHGFKSQDTLNRAKQELLEADLIRQTRSGMFMNPGGRCALYALTWQAIDECPGKGLECKATTLPLRSFRKEAVNK